MSQRSNGNYLEALAAVTDSTPLHQLLDRVSHAVHYHRRRVRALRIGDPTDLALLTVIARGEFSTAGFRNRDLRRLLPPPRRAAPTDRQRAAQIGRQLRLLRAHGVIQKIPKTHRYKLTPNGHLLTAALFAVRGASLTKLLATAA